MICLSNTPTRICADTSLWYHIGTMSCQRVIATTMRTTVETVGIEREERAARQSSLTTHFSSARPQPKRITTT